MVSKIGGPSRTSTNKTSKAKNTGKSGGTSFAKALEEASASSQVDAVSPSAPAGAILPELYASSGEYVPTEAKARASYLIKRLEELEKDILIGSPTKAVMELKKALETTAINRDELTPKQRKLIDEIDMRASVEIAKMEVSE